ncbi:MAG: UvrD-helicase domain-containing protein [Hydrogenophaga sp.]|nr:UvrD-helicase domain-containing protein [Hydrogenophaga sp.]
MNPPDTCAAPQALEAAYRINGSQVAREAFYALACDPARSVAVEACAGAGKTWMLVSRILRALLDGCAPQDILAITFTKKAAGEMRDRLNAEMRRCASLPDAELVEALITRGMSAAEAARRVDELRGLHQRVTALGRPVQVRTFHSWFAALLRGAPLSVLQELRLPAQYELLEDDARAVALVWPRFYAALAASPQDRADFMDCVAEHGRHQTLKALLNALQKRVEFALADAAGVVEASVQTFGALHPQWQALPSPELSLASASARDRWHAWARALATETNKTPKAAATAVIDAFLLPDDLGHMARRFALLRKAFFVAGDDRLTNHLAKYPAAQEAEAELQALCAARRQHLAWLHHQRMARLTRVLLAAYAELKRERGWVDMNDVEGAAQRLLGDPELSGWMQQRLDARVRHVLIDEFQDTNPLQWQSLYGWLSSYAGAGPGEAPCVFLVGDPKQSIYRFRRAEPQVFKAAQAFVVQGLSGALLSCDHTRRCARSVVDALNGAMLAAVQSGEYGSAYRAHTTQSTEPGAVLALPQLPRSLRERDGGTAGVEPVWRDSLNTPRVLPEDTMSALEAGQAADWIADEITSGRVQPGGVMVLSRRRERLGWMFEALQERGIASEQPEKLDLCDAPAVQDVVALLDSLVSPRHDLSLARALRSPIFGWDDAALAQLARLRQRMNPRGASETSSSSTGASTRVQLAWWDVLQRHAAPLSSSDAAGQWVDDAGAFEPVHDLMRETARRLALYRQWVQTLPPHDALSAIYEDSDLLARFAQAVPATQRPAVLAQLRDLLAQSLAQEGGRFLTAYRLVRALKAGGIKATPTPSPGAVRLLTIHGAKGLEAHTVLLLDTDAGPSRPDSMGVLVDWPGEDAVPRRFVFLASEKAPPACAQSALLLEQQARALEELNALYVALTRAEERLVLSSFEPHQRSSTTTWYQRLHALATPMEAPLPATPAAEHAEAADFALPTLPVVALSRLFTAAQAPSASEQHPAQPEDDSAARSGLALHRLLQWVPTPAHGFEWSPMHLRAASREFGLGALEEQALHSAARHMITGPAAWAWDSQVVDSCGNEVELFHQGELLRLDRLVRHRAAGHWWVLDFKSAERPQDQPGLVAQMLRYREALAAAQPGAVVRLAFINPLGELIELAADPATA